MNQALGRHVLCEAYGCDPQILDDIGLIEVTMVDAALSAGAEVREVAFHKFSPQGVSGMVIISESHLAIHTWPELDTPLLTSLRAATRWTRGTHVTT